MSVYRDAFEYVLGRFIDAIRAQVDDDDAQILEKWNQVVGLDILEVVSRFRQDEAESFDRWVHGYAHCVGCGKEMLRLEMYSYESRELKKVDYYYTFLNKGPNHSGACYDCQKAFLDKHTFICPDCGSTYFRGNYLQVRCPSCQEVESRIVPHKTRASKLERAATLTHIEWSQTLEHFHGACVYCGGDYEVVEHFTPLTHETGETSARNCIPSCIRCNSIKKDLDGRTEPNKLAVRLNIPPWRIREIEEYLDTR